MLSWEILVIQWTQGSEKSVSDQKCANRMMDDASAESVSEVQSICPKLGHSTKSLLESVTKFDHHFVYSGQARDRHTDISDMAPCHRSNILVVFFPSSIHKHTKTWPAVEILQMFTPRSDLNYSHKRLWAEVVPCRSFGRCEGSYMIPLMDNGIKFGGLFI